MPFDVTVVREAVRWNRAISSALSEGVEALEDHLLGLGYDDLDLNVEVRNLAGGMVSVQAELRLPSEPIARHAEDLDLPMLLGRLLGELAEEATPERLARGGAVAQAEAPSTDPWTAITPRLSAIAHREVRHAIEFGDIPAGWVEANDLVDEAVLEVLDGGSDEPPSLRALARRVRGLLRERITAASDESKDVFLDEVVPQTDGSEAMVQDEFYDYRVEDETPLRGSDVMGEFVAPEDRIAVDEPTEPG